MMVQAVKSAQFFFTFLCKMLHKLALVPSVVKLLTAYLLVTLLRSLISIKETLRLLNKKNATRKWIEILLK